jgi:hypothetical protein
VKYDRPISELLAECVQKLREPYTAKQIVAWFAARYPDVAEGSVRAHINAMNGSNLNRGTHQPFLGSRPPLLRQISRGQYVRWSGSALRAPSLPEPPPPPSLPKTQAKATRGVATEEWSWEGNVQARLLRHLTAEGWDITRVADTGSKESGTDVIVRRDGRTMHLEVKGWPSASYRDPAKADLTKPTLPATQARVWFNDGVVHVLRLRESHPDDAVGLVFPDYPTYRRLAEGIGGSLRRCEIEVLLVAADGQCEVITP